MFILGPFSWDLAKEKYSFKNYPVPLKVDSKALIPMTHCTGTPLNLRCTGKYNKSDSTKGYTPKSA